MYHLLHLELVRIRVADDRRFARSWRRRRRADRPESPAATFTALPTLQEAPVRACA